MFGRSGRQAPEGLLKNPLLSDAHPLTRLLAPRSIALYGASPVSASPGRMLLQSLIRGHYSGRLSLINPHHGSLLGRPCVPRAAELDHVPDLAIAAVPAPAVTHVIEDCARHGIRFVLAPATEVARGRESSLLAQWTERRQQIRQTAERLGVRVLGPSSMGLMRPALGLHAAYSQAPLQTGSLALVSQSGGLMDVVTDWAAASGVGFSSVIHPGWGEDIDLDEILDFLLYDRDTQAVALAPTRPGNARRWVSALRGLARAKPVLVLRPGMDAATAAVFDAALARTGAIRVKSLQQWYSGMQLLGARMAQTWRRDVRRVMILSNSAALGQAGHDRLQDHGLKPATLDAGIRTSLDTRLERHWGGDNPVEIHADAPGDHYAQAIETLSESTHVDALVAIHRPHPAGSALEVANALAFAAVALHKPLCPVLCGGATVQDGWALLEQHGLPRFDTPEAAVDALGLLARIAHARNWLRHTPDTRSRHQAPDVKRARELIDHARNQRKTSLSIEETQTLLACFGLSITSEGHPNDGSTPDRFRATVFDAPGFGRVMQLERKLYSTQAITLPPLNTTLAEAALVQAGLPVPGDPLIVAVVCLSALICECPEIVRLRTELIYSADNERWLLRKMDIELNLAEKPLTRYPHLAIHPYPSDLESTYTGPDGSVFRLRAIHPDDAQAERRLFASLSEDAVRMRFMAPLRELSDAQIERFTQIDYDRELALVALAPDSEDFAGVGRFSSTTDPTACEFAVVVADAWQRRGLAEALMQRLFPAAAERGYTQMVGRVVSGNDKMLAFCRKLGFRVEANPSDAGEMLVARHLKGVPG